MYHHSRTGSNGSSGMVKDISLGFEFNTYLSNKIGDDYGSTGMRPSSGQSYILEKNHSILNIERPINGYDSHLNYISTLTSELHFPKKEVNPQMERSHYFRGEPIKAIRDLVGDNKYGSFATNYESTYVPSYTQSPDKKFNLNFQNIGNQIDSKYHSSPISVEIPDKSRSKSDFKTRNIYGNLDSSRTSGLYESGYVSDRYVPSTASHLNPYDSYLQPQDLHQRDTSCKRVSTHLNDLLAKVKRDEEIYKQKKEALDKEINEKRKKQMIYDPNDQRVDYLAILKNTIAQRRSKSYSFMATNPISGSMNYQTHS